MKRLLAPNGKPSKLNEEQYKLVRTPAFKKWFGDWENDPENASKVVDENGEPLVVYHGTASDFNIFKIGRTGGIFLTNNKNSAERFSSGDLKRTGSNPKTLNCFINIKKYYDKNTNDEILVDNYYQDYFENRPFIKKQSQKNILKNKFKQYFWDLVSFGIVNEEPLNFLIKKGYDGIIIDSDNNSNSYILFESNQIKLADGTNTTFDSNNSDIRFDNGGETSISNIFWGKVAGGVLIYSKKTDRFLLLKRSEYVLEPNTWGIISGKLDADENIEEAVIRETKEETGFQLKSIIPAYVFKSNGFTFHNFVSIIDDEFIPVLNWENTEHGWFKLNEFPKNLHFGLELLIQNTDLKDLTNKYSNGGEINNTNIFAQIWGWFGIKF